jgi:hypothetical protein
MFVFFKYILSLRLHLVTYLWCETTNQLLRVLHIRIDTFPVFSVYAQLVFTSSLRMNILAYSSNTHYGEEKRQSKSALTTLSDDLQDTVFPELKWHIIYELKKKETSVFPHFLDQNHNILESLLFI